MEKRLGELAEYLHDEMMRVQIFSREEKYSRMLASNMAVVASKPIYDKFVETLQEDAGFQAVVLSTIGDYVRITKPVLNSRWPGTDKRVWESSSDADFLDYIQNMVYDTLSTVEPKSTNYTTVFTDIKAATNTYFELPEWYKILVAVLYFL